MRPNRIIAFAIGGAAVFAVVLVFVIAALTSRGRERRLAEAASESQRLQARQASPMLRAAEATAGPFVAHVTAGRFAEAHALMAASYRKAVAVDAFAEACQTSPVLARAGAVRLTRMRQDGATVEATGVIDSAVGAVPATFVLLPEAGTLHILKLSLTDAPVLDATAR
jgi:hypothetical protein